jgi:hypothetical protein
LSIKNNQRRFIDIRAVCHFSKSQIIDVKGETENIVERKRMRRIIQIITL